MDSSSKTLSLSAQIVPKECENSKHNPTTMKEPSSLRTQSFSTSSSLSSNSSIGSSSSSAYNPDHDDHDHTSPIRFSGVPFSWEHLPGIPKQQNSKKKQESSSNKQQILPLPPPTTPTSSASKKFNMEDIWAKTNNKNNKHHHHPKQTIQRDPFFAALVQCSKNDDEEDQSNASFWNGGKVTRSLSDRFGFVNLYSSCKRTCTVSESIIYLPRSSRSSYDLVNTPSRLS